MKKKVNEDVTVPNLLTASPVILIVLYFFQSDLFVRLIALVDNYLGTSQT